MTLSEDCAFERGPDLDVLVIDEALRGLAAEDAELARIVELRFFGGLSAPEAAEALGMSLRSLERGYTVARMWLLRHLEGDGADAARTPA